MARYFGRDISGSLLLGIPILRVSRSVELSLFPISDEPDANGKPKCASSAKKQIFVTLKIIDTESLVQFLLYDLE